MITFYFSVMIWLTFQVISLQSFNVKFEQKKMSTVFLADFFTFSNLILISFLQSFPTNFRSDFDAQNFTTSIDLSKYEVGIIIGLKN